MTKARYVASFVAHGGGKALFVGLYKIGNLLLTRNTGEIQAILNGGFNFPSA